MDVKEQELLGPDCKDHWYYVSKGMALRSMLGDERIDGVLDVGAGSGVFSRQLIDYSVAQNAVCVDPAYSGDWDEEYRCGSIQFRQRVESVPQKLILMIDVLEHVDDDLALLKEYTDQMPVGGKVLISVPAFQFLWSGHDDFLDHKRRYTLDGLQKVVKAAGLEIKRSNYFFGSVFPVAIALRLKDRMWTNRPGDPPKSQLKPVSGMLNNLLTVVHSVERYTLFPFNKFAGLSVLCLASRT